MLAFSYLLSIRPRPIKRHVKRHRRSIWNRFSNGETIDCHWCKKPLEKDRWTRDHVIPRCLGGSLRLHNIVPSCGPCNWERGRKMGDPRPKLIFLAWVAWLIDSKVLIVSQVPVTEEKPQ